METTLSHEIKVGIFAVVGIVLFCLSIILLGGDKFFLTPTYYLHIRMPQAQGLGKGSVVVLSGVPVGNVDKINFIDKSSEVEIVISLQKAVQNRVTEGSQASVKTQGALGDKYIFIQPGPLDATPLKDGAILAVDKTPDFLDIIASKGAEMGEVVEVIKEVRLLFASLNRDGRTGRLISNLVESSDQFGRTMVEMRETMKLMRTDAIVPLASVMKKLDKGQGTLGALINDSSLHQRLTSLLGEAPRNKFLKPIIRDSIETNEQKR